MITEGAVDDRVADQLSKLLAAEGVTICTAPIMFGDLMRQACPDDELAIQTLEKVLTAGIVKSMRDGASGADQMPALTERLKQSTGMPDDHARWAISAWWRALQQFAGGSRRDWTSWNTLDVRGHGNSGTTIGASQRSMAHLAFVGLAGALGGMAWGLFTLALGDQLLVEVARSALEDLAQWEQVFALVALGAPGGLAGGVLGWIGGGVRSWTYDAQGGTSFARLALGALGAFGGALFGSYTGLVLIGLAGVMFGSLIGGGLGGLLGLFTAERAARWWGIY